MFYRKRKEKVNQYGLEYWFEPTMDLQRENGTSTRMEHCVIEKGDLLHCDFGIRYMNMCTDTQRLAYVAKDNEESIPEKLKQGMKVGNRFQDIVKKIINCETNKKFIRVHDNGFIDIPDVIFYVLYESGETDSKG